MILGYHLEIINNDSSIFNYRIGQMNKKQKNIGQEGNNTITYIYLYVNYLTFI